MTRYLVVAHQSATEPHLPKRIRTLAGRDHDATFTPLFPATRVALPLRNERRTRA